MLGFVILENFRFFKKKTKENSGKFSEMANGLTLIG